MVGLKKMLEICYTKQERYNVVIEFMNKVGIVFKEAKPDHLNNCYRIMEDDSSVFVLSDGFKLNCCENDKKLLDDVPNIKFEILYKNRAQKIQDNVRPFTCTIKDPDLFEEAIYKLAGERTSNINIAVSPRRIITGDDGNIKCICPNCGITFLRAPRCPDCGQLILYSENKEKWNKPKLENLEAWIKAATIVGATPDAVADFVRELTRKDGFSYHIGAVDMAIDIVPSSDMKPVQLIMLFGKGDSCAFQPKELFDYLAKYNLSRTIAEEYMELMRPFLASEQKNVNDKIKMYRNGKIKMYNS